MEGRTDDSIPPLLFPSPKKEGVWGQYEPPSRTLNILAIPSDVLRALASTSHVAYRGRDPMPSVGLNEGSKSSSSSFEFEFELARSFLYLLKSLSVE